VSSSFRGRAGAKHRDSSKHSSSTPSVSSVYLSNIECGMVASNVGTSDSNGGGRNGDGGQRVYEAYSPFFGCVVELYFADNYLSPGRILFRAASLARKSNCTLNRVAMYLAGQRSAEAGVFQAASFRKKPRGCSELKQKGYFVSMYASQQYVLREQRKSIASQAAAGTVMTAAPFLGSAQLETSGTLAAVSQETETNTEPGLSPWCVYTGLSATGQGVAKRVFPVEQLPAYLTTSGGTVAEQDERIYAYLQQRAMTRVTRDQPGKPVSAAGAALHRTSRRRTLCSGRSVCPSDSNSGIRTSRGGLAAAAPTPVQIVRTYPAAPMTSEPTVAAPVAEGIERFTTQQLKAELLRRSQLPPSETLDHTPCIASPYSPSAPTV
jgi:hypothetical protein